MTDELSTGARALADEAIIAEAYERARHGLACAGHGLDHTLGTHAPLAEIVPCWREHFESALWIAIELARGVRVGEGNGVPEPLEALRRLVYAIEDNETIRYRVLSPVREGEPGPSDDQEVIDALNHARGTLQRVEAGSREPLAASSGERTPM